MNSSDIRSEFRKLRASGVDGDVMAASQLESRFGRRLSRYIRRVLRSGVSTDSLTEFVLTEARLIHRQAGLEREELVREVVHRLCAAVTGQSLDGRRDTVSGVDRQTVFSA